jgi:hypothetical protein
MGAATSATVLWTANNTWNVPITQTPGDLRMMKGYIDTNDTSITSITVSGLPAALTAEPYAVILYFDGDNATQTRVGKYTLSGAASGNRTMWGRDAAGSNFNGMYVLGSTPVDPLPGASGAGLDNQGTAASTVPAGNYMFFPEVTGSTFTISAQASVSSGTTNRAGIQGIQIVPSTMVPEPGTLAVIGMAVMGLAMRRRR